MLESATQSADGAEIDANDSLFDTSTDTLEHTKDWWACRIITTIPYFTEEYICFEVTRKRYQERGENSPIDRSP